MKFYFKILYQIDNTFYLFTCWCKNLKNPYFTILDAICLWNSGPKPGFCQSLAAYMLSRTLHRSLGSLYSVFLAGVFTFSLFYFSRWQHITVRCLMWTLKGSVTQRPTSLEAGLHPPRKPRPTISTAEGLWTQWVELWLFLLYFLPKYCLMIEWKLKNNNNQVLHK